MPFIKLNEIPNKEELNGNEKLYINDNGVSKQVLVKELIAESMTPVTYEELKDLCDNGHLVPGIQYRITDYNCVTTSDLTFGNGCRCNKFADHNTYAIFGESCYGNIFIGSSYNNIFCSSFIYNTVGRNAMLNFFDVSNYSNVFGDDVQNCVFGKNFMCNNVGKSCQYITVTTNDGYIRGLNMDNHIRGTRTAKLELFNSAILETTNTVIVPVRYVTRGDGNTIFMWWNGGSTSMTKTVYYKTSPTDTDWILAT